MAKSRARDRARKAASKSGGRKAGPPSERLSLYLETPLVASVRLKAKDRNGTISDVVRQALKDSENTEDRFTVEEFEEALKMSPLARSTHFLNQEQYDQLGLAFGMGMIMLSTLKAFTWPYLQIDSRWQEYYKEREAEVVKMLTLFHFIDEAEARKFVREDIDRRIAEGRAKVKKTLAGELIAEQAEGARVFQQAREQILGEPPLEGEDNTSFRPTLLLAPKEDRKAQRFKGFSLKTLFRKKDGPGR